MHRCANLPSFKLFVARYWYDQEECDRLHQARHHGGDQWGQLHCDNAHNAQDHHHLLHPRTGIRG